MRKPMLGIALLAALLAVFVGCSRKPDDEAIVKDIQQKVASDPDTKDANLTMNSKDGQVTLNGKTTTPAAREKAAQIAKAEPGVTSLDNEIAVEQAAMTPTPEASAPAAAATAPVQQAPPPPPAEKPKPTSRS